MKGMVRKINNDEDLMKAVDETREAIIFNDGENSLLLEYCTIANIKKEQARNKDMTFEDILQDLIWESWGEDC